MIDREVLAAALEKPWPVHWEKNSIIAAATKYLAQLPEKCETCEGDGDEPGTVLNCPTCHGSGKVYPAELVERIAQALRQCWKQEATFAGMAVAVLDALNGTADG